jgi:hypothetical protein
MNTLRKSADLYDVSTYSDKELYDILDLHVHENISDNILEAKILGMINKYDDMTGETAELLTQFFMDMYARFFEINSSDTETETEMDTEVEENDYTEGFAVSGVNDYYVNTNSDLIKYVNEYDTGNSFTGNTYFNNYEGNPADTKSPKITQVFSVNEVKNRGVLDVNANDRNTGNAQLTKPVDYKKDTLNPLLKQTVKRVISIDSQYREDKNRSSTEFTFNLSEPLKDVVSLKLYSIQIPYTWYTITSNYGGNFFYIKGNALGIDNGNHDYKIGIKSGNYNAKELIDAVETSIHTLKTDTPDVSFGNTSITYDTNNVLSTIVIDIKEVFGESNYYVKFPSRDNSLQKFMGYTKDTYDVCSVRSEVILDMNASVDISNCVIQIKTYTVSDPKTMDYNTKDMLYNNINIIIPDGLYRINELVTQINTIIKKNTRDFDDRHSYMEIDVSKNIVLNIKPTRAFLQNVENIKTVVVFPDNSFIWHSSSSTMKFPNYINEFSHIHSENTTAKSRYKIDQLSDYIDISSNNAYYTSLYHIDISDNSNPGYTLIDYIKEINRSIHAITDLSNTTMNYSEYNDKYIYFDVSVNKVYTEKDYYIQFNGENISKLADVSDGILYNMNEKNSYIFDLNKVNNGNTFNLSGYIRFYLRDNSGVSTMDISLNQANVSSNAALFEVLNKNIKEGKDIYNINNQSPLSGTDVSANTKTVTFRINNFLKTEDYSLVLKSKNDNWYSHLGFIGETVYIDGNYNARVYDLSLNTKIKNTKQLNYNTIELNINNNYFDLIPFNDIDGLNAIGHPYKRTITLEHNKTYTIDEIYSQINDIFDADNLLKWSRITNSDTTNNTGNTIMRININKVFRSNDYKLVFYDAYSFVTCYTGASRNGNKYVQNTTWDTTLGWILGFRESIIYYLADYYNENICILVGDTTVTTSLYNYFLIVLDDYTQNHLNDGLVTITPQETAIDVEPYTYMCDPYGSAQIAVPLSAIDKNGTIIATQKKLYTFNEKLLSKQVKDKSYSKGPFVKDIFGIIPMKTSTLTPGTVYVESAGTLQDQERLYFGPVNIHRMTIRLLNDRGDLVDLNNQNWSFSLVCEQLYRSNL